MDTSVMGGERHDYYSVNNDWAGIRDVQDAREAVQYHTGSSIRIWCNEQDMTYDYHWHTALEIIMPTENYYDVELGSTVYHIQPGGILFIIPGETHRLSAPPDGRRFIFLFDASLFAGIKGWSSITTLLSQSPLITRETYPMVYEDVRETLMRVRDEYFGMREYTELTACALMLNLFAKLGYNHIYAKDRFPGPGPSRQQEHIKKISDLLDYIDVHYTESLNLENMAAHVGFSKFYFSRLFKQYTGFTFNDYLNYRRLKAAEELLADPGISITEVALRSGFSSISSFNRLFKESRRCTPKEYRILNKKAF